MSASRGSFHTLQPYWSNFSSRLSDISLTISSIPEDLKIPSGISASWPKWTGLHPLMWPFTDIPATPASNWVADTLWSGEELSAMVISSNRVCQFGKTLRLLMLAVLSFTVCCQNILGAFAKFWPVTLATTRIFLAQTNLCLTLRL